MATFILLAYLLVSLYCTCMTYTTFVMFKRRSLVVCGHRWCTKFEMNQGRDQGGHREFRGRWRGRVRGRAFRQGFAQRFGDIPTSKMDILFAVIYTVRESEK